MSFPALPLLSLPGFDCSGDEDEGGIPMTGNLDHSPADIVRYLMIDLGLGTLPEDEGEWPIGCSSEMPTPDDALVTFDIEGTDDGTFQTTGEIQGQSGVQIQLRSALFPLGWKKCNTIYQTLSKGVYDTVVTLPDYGATTFTRYRVHSLSFTTDILSLGTDAPSSKRRLFSMNCVASILKLTDS